MDDSVRNVTAAHRLGMYSVLVGKSSIPDDAECDLAVENVTRLHTAAPWLFNNPALAMESTDGAHSLAAFAGLPGASEMWRSPSACAAEAEHPERGSMADDRAESTDVAHMDVAAVTA